MDAKLRQAYLECQSIARRQAANFYWAFRFLTTQKRWALSAVYAFCRIADDIADESDDVERGREELQRLRKQFDLAMSGAPEGSVFVALSDACRRFSIPKQPFEDLMAGIEMDLDHTRYQTIADTESYCRRVASSAGQMSIAIFGAHHPNSVLYADEVGLALQWTNILRDIGEDARRGRVYVPDELLSRFNITREDVLTLSDNTEWEPLMTEISRIALDHYRKANQLLPPSDLKALVVAEIMKSIYLGTLQNIIRKHYPVLRKRVSLSSVSKVTIALSVAFRIGVLGFSPKSIPLFD
jgi:phytoene synthase